MDTNEQIKALTERVTQLELELKRAPMTSFQRMVYDDRGRGIVVTVGGNN